MPADADAVYYGPDPFPDIKGKKGEHPVKGPAKVVSLAVLI